jgi:acyl-CoA oxidase
MLGTLVQGRVSIAGAGTSAAQVALTVAVKYALQRRQFGGEHGEHLLLDYRMHRRRLLPLVARTYALRAAQHVLVDELDALLSGPVRDPDGAASDPVGSAGLEPGGAAANEPVGSAPNDPDGSAGRGPDTPEDPESRVGAPDALDDDRRRRALEARAAGTKALATWHAVHTIQQSREACGGAGYLSENRFAALRADTDVFTTFEGDNHVLLQLVAKAQLTDYTSAFDELDTLGVVRTIAGQAVETVIERTALHQIVERIRDTFAGNDHWDADAGLRDPEYHLAMLRWREEHQLAALVRRMKHASDQGLSHDEIFDRVQPHLIDCGRWHVERQILEAFVDWERALPDGPEKDAMNLLADLHALSLIESDRGWWMEHGRLSADRAKEMTRTVDSLCDQAASLADDLVDAFGVPRECWDVPMLDQDPGPAHPDPSVA